METTYGLRNEKRRKISAKKKGEGLLMEGIRTK